MNPVGRSGIHLQQRDIEILRGLFESRIATTAHLAALYFAGRREAAKKRLQRLKAERFIRERPRMPFEPAILFLTKQGFEVLSKSGYLTGYPAFTWAKLKRRIEVSPLTLQHELDVMDMKGAVLAGTRSQPALSVIEFSTWPRLSEFSAFHPTTRKKMTIRPDGFLRLRDVNNPGAADDVFYVEVDRSTETLRVLANHVRSYADHYRRGGLAERLGHTPSEFRRFPFRVLVVCKTAERRDNIAKRLLFSDPPVRTSVLLSTLDEVKAEPFGPIWITPAAYQVPITGKTIENRKKGLNASYSARSS